MRKRIGALAAAAGSVVLLLPAAPAAGDNDGIPECRSSWPYFYYTADWPQEADKDRNDNGVLCWNVNAQRFYDDK